MEQKKPSKNDSKPPMVISYLRFSSAPQERGDSVRRQLEMSEKYAAERGWKISDDLRDMGISAFRGANAKDGKLGAFLRLVELGKIPKGSVLLVESFDRLSRNELPEALQNFLSVINAGVTVVTLSDGYEFKKENCNLQNLMYSLMIMARAREESERKSQRGAAAWNAKRKRAATEILTKTGPSWCKVVDGKFQLDEAKAKVVRRMFKMAIDGKGMTVIANTLNKEGISISRRHDKNGNPIKHWQNSVVRRLLTDRLAIGEYQPRTVSYVGNVKKYVPTGEPIKGYYPRVISDDVFYAAQAAIQSRKNHGGKVNSFTNLFKGILFAMDGSPLWVYERNTNQARSSKKTYVSSAAKLQKQGAVKPVYFPIEPFEQAILFRLNDVSLFANNTDKEQEVRRLQLKSIEGQILGAKKQSEQVQESMLNDSQNTPSVVALLNKLDVRIAQLEDKADQIRGELARESGTGNRETIKLVSNLIGYEQNGQKKKISEDQRKELQHALGSLIERIDCHFIREGYDYICSCRILFRNGVEEDFEFRADWVDNRDMTIKKRNAKGQIAKPSKQKTEFKPPKYLVTFQIPIDGKMTRITLGDESELEQIKSVMKKLQNIL